MNKKQKTVLWISAIPIIGKLAGSLQVAIHFGAWDTFFRRTIRALPFYFFVVIVAGILTYALKDKKTKKGKKKDDVDRFLDVIKRHPNADGLFNGEVLADLSEEICESENKQNMQKKTSDSD